MTEEEMEEVFSLFGYSSMFEKLRYPLFLSGEMDNVDSGLLESFFAWYSFDESKPILFDDFLYHFRIFKMIEKRNILPEIY